MKEKVFTAVVEYKFCHRTCNQNSNELGKQKMRCRNFLAGLSQISPLYLAWGIGSQQLPPDHSTPTTVTKRKIQGWT
jgi:hypothetical protein